jgi:ABC-type spermidine/putrescine transport system permease subunit II
MRGDGMMQRDIIGLFLKAWMILIISFLFIPILVVVFYSFNDGRVLFIWEGFSTFWYGAVFDNHRILSALGISVRSALMNVAISVVLGTVAGVAIARHQGVWSGPFLLLMGFVLVTPELVSAIGQVIWFNQLGIENGIARLAIGHSRSWPWWSRQGLKGSATHWRRLRAIWVPLHGARFFRSPCLLCFPR